MTRLKKFLLSFLFALAVFSSASCSACAQQFDPRLYAGMRWRMIGPFRGGRVLGVTGVPGQPDVYYFGAVGGGVWKTTDGGRVWKPIFDHEPIASIGAVAVAPSDPNLIYVGTGEADMRSDISFGDGVYKSADGGKTWQHIGLEDARQIGRILVDPRDPNIVLVAALGHAYAPNAERGVFRSADGGKTWQKVLYKDENTGAIDLCFDPENSWIVYAALWRTRRPPWSSYPPLGGPGSGLYKSTDGGVSWTRLAGHGLPSQDVGRIGIAVAYADNGNRVYALVDAHRGGLYRSDDAGETWRLVGADPRIWSRGWYFGGVFADPRNPDVIYVANVSLYRSTDGGKTFAAIKGAPGGDDYHFLWIAPDDPRRMIVGSDQGATITVDGGKTWSSWYNQPTAQFYHVATDNRFPYYVYGAQQDSGTVAIASRSDYGEITYRDWYSVGAGESGYILPDPLDPNIVYGGGTYGPLFRFNRATGQSRNISPWPVRGFHNQYRFTWTSPLAFSPQDSRVLYFGSQFLFRSANGGMSWQILSPDLTRSLVNPSSLSKQSAAPAKQSEPARGVIYTIAPSPVESGLIWVGTDNGLIQLTRDAGRTWRNVTPKGLPAWSKISLIEASPFDAAVAYVAVDRHRLDDLRPYIFRTRDFGRSWAALGAGIPSYVHAVREDPVRKGLLFAGTETGVDVSFDSGDHWQSLQLSLPAVSVRDLVIHANDLVIATHGRAFWILDDIAPLRQINARVARASAYLFRPAAAIRIRPDENRDTPLPPETPVGENPPPGAILDYVLKSAPQGEIALEIRDANGKLVRRFSSVPGSPPNSTPPPFAADWLRAPLPLSKNPGMNRFVWDLRYPPPRALEYGYSMAAVYGQNTPTVPQGPLVLLGKYEVTLVVAGKRYTEPLTVRMDPRVKAPPAALEKQLALELQIDDSLGEVTDTHNRILNLRSQLETLRQRLAQRRGGEAILAAADKLDRKAAAVEGEPRPWPAQGEGLASLSAAFAELALAVDGSDAPPTAQDVEAFRQARAVLRSRLAAWNDLLRNDLPRLNALIRPLQLSPIRLPNASPAAPR